jgi:hypothetical protein
LANALFFAYTGRGAEFGRLPGAAMRRTTAKPSLEDTVIVPNRKAVRAYLKRHGDLAVRLPAVCEAARKEFGSEAELALELYRDPEIRDHYLTLYVRLDSYDGETMARIERVSAPFERRLAQSSGYLLVTTDFRPTRGANGV